MIPINYGPGEERVLVLGSSGLKPLVRILVEVATGVVSCSFVKLNGDRRTSGVDFIKVGKSGVFSSIC